MDGLMREMMEATPPPSLSYGFDQRLMRRLRPRRLGSAGRAILAAYALFGIVLSIWAMRSQSIDWSLTVIAILAPVILAAAVQHRHRTHTARRRHALQGR